MGAIGPDHFVELLKTVFSRDRPDLVPHGMEVQTASFPSGHSLMSAVTWLTVATIMAQTLKDRRSKVFVISMAILIAMLVGFSRVYLGVHWPTDVLAGWSVGAAWALMIWLIARRLQQRSQIEPEGGAENEHNAAASPP